jgi:hypothetical protein
MGWGVRPLLRCRKAFAFPWIHNTSLQVKVLLLHVFTLLAAIYQAEPKLPIAGEVYSNDSVC